MTKTAIIVLKLKLFNYYVYYKARSLFLKSIMILTKQLSIIIINNATVILFLFLIF